MCRYSDVTRLKWSNVRFEPDLGLFEITFERIRENYQLRQGNKVTVSATNALVCPLKLLLKLKDNDVNYTLDAFTFRGFYERVVAKNPQNTIPYDVAIKYQQYMRYRRLRTPNPGFFRLIPYTPVPPTDLAARGCRRQITSIYE